MKGLVFATVFITVATGVFAYARLSGSMLAAGSETVAATSSVIVASDSFTPLNLSDLAFHSTDTISAWTEAYDSVGSNYITVRSTGGIRPNVSNGSGVPRLVYVPTLAVPIREPNYDINLEFLLSSGQADDGVYIPLRWTDANNHCGLQWYGAGATRDMMFYKTVAGRVTILGTPANANPTSGDDITITVRPGGVMTAEVNGTQVTSATDAYCDDNAVFGVAFGAGTKVTGTDVSTAMVLGTLTVTYGSTVSEVPGSSDTTAPTGEILSPVFTGGTLSTSTASHSIRGNYADNAAVSTITYGVTGASTGSGPCTFSGGSFACPPFVFRVGTSTFAVTITDTSGNSITRAITIVLTVSDTTDPSCVILNPASPYTATSSPLVITARCSDNVAVASMSWVNSAGSSGSFAIVPGATATATASVPLFSGVPNNVVVNGFDESGNDDATPPTLAVTYVANVSILTGSLPSGRQGETYPPCVTATGGRGPYRWTLTTGKLPTGLALDGSAGPTLCFTGILSAAGTFSFTLRVTDGSGGACPGAGCATRAYTITVRAPGSEGPHDYFNMLKVRPDVYPIAVCEATVAPDSGACSLRDQDQLLGLRTSQRVYPMFTYKFDMKDPFCYWYALYPDVTTLGGCGFPGDPYPDAQDGAKVHFWEDRMPPCAGSITADCILSIIQGVRRCYVTAADDREPDCHQGNPGQAAATVTGSTSGGSQLHFEIDPDVSNGSMLVTFDYWFSCSWLTNLTGTTFDQIGRNDWKFAPWQMVAGNVTYRSHSFYQNFGAELVPPLDNNSQVAGIGYHYDQNALYTDVPSISATGHASWASELLYHIATGKVAVPCGKWIRVWSYVKIQSGNAHEAGSMDAFHSWPAGNYSQVWAYVATEDMEPTLLVNGVGIFGHSIDYFQFELDSSNIRRVWLQDDLITYFRNVVFLRNPPSNWTDDASGIGLRKPVR